MHISIEVFRKTSLAYNIACKPVCKELGLPQTAFDILLFLGNNPTYKTASEIVELRNLKANLVSVNVDRLVQDGYLVRKPSAEDRRKTELFCTDKAWPVIERGRELQRAFFDMLFADTDENTRKAFFGAIHQIENNLNTFLEEKDNI